MRRTADANGELFVTAGLLLSGRSLSFRPVAPSVTVTRPDESRAPAGPRNLSPLLGIRRWIYLWITMFITLWILADRQPNPEVDLGLSESPAVATPLFGPAGVSRET